MKKTLKNIIVLLSALIISPYFYIKIFLKKLFSKNKQKRILVINNAKIGDLICTTPIFRAIKERYPDSYLAVLATPKTEGILQNNKRIDKLIVYSINEGVNLIGLLKLTKKISKENFNMAINIIPGTTTLLLPFLAGISKRITAVVNEYGWFYRLLSVITCSNRFRYLKNTLSIKNHLSLLRFIDINDENLQKEVFITREAKMKSKIFLKSRNIEKGDIVVGMCLTAGNKIKEWGVENFAKLADMIINKYGHKIIIAGGPADKQILKQANKLTRNKIIITHKDFLLSETPALFKRFDYFISVDTGPLYIANALGVPVVDIIGPCSTDDQPPVYEKCKIVHAENLQCRPCSFYGVTVTKCREGHLKCLKEISPELVLKNFDKLIKRYGK